MRINEPVTQHDMGMADDCEIISTTSLKGIITSANDDFIHMSGFSWEELENKNHNIIPAIQTYLQKPMPCFGLL